MKKGILSTILVVILAAFAVTGLAETAAQDPILALYPGLEMGMSTEDIYSKYGEDVFDKFAFDTDTVEVTLENGQTYSTPVSDLYLRARHEFHGKPVVVMFEIDDNKLIAFGAVMNDNELMDELINEMKKVYGEVETPAESGMPLLDLVNMMSGSQKFGWKTDAMRIEVEYVSNGNQIKYLPIQ